jgi:integrase
MNGCGNNARADHAAHKIPSNPGEHIAHLPESHIERDWLRRGEIPLYPAACSDLYRPVAELLIATGMRISEALACAGTTSTSTGE